MRNDPDLLFERFRRTGDPEALALLFDRTAPQLLTVARHLLADAVEAEDVVQATFLAAIEGAERFDPRRPVLPWLVGILTRQAGLARRARRRPDADRLGEQRAAQPDEPGEAVARAELASVVRRAVAELPAPYDEVLVLHLAEGQRPQEIARRLGRPAGTVRVQLHRGLDLLRRALPAGLASGVASATPVGSTALGTGKGLAAVRAEVLASASSAAATKVATGSLVLGGALMSKWMVAAAGVALAGLVVLIARTSPDEPRHVAVAGNVASPVAEVASSEREAAPPRAASISEPGPTTDRRSVVAPVSPSQDEPSQAGGGPAQRSAGRFGLRGRVVDGGGAPVQGARLSVWLRVPDGVEADWPARSRAVVSDANGGFALTDLPWAPGGAQVRAEGFAPTNVASANTPVLLDAGPDFDLGEVRLQRGVAISGRVLDVVTGAGVADATLFLARNPPSTFERRGDGYAWQVGTADDEGRFRLRDRLALTGESRFGNVLIGFGEEGVGWVPFELLDGEPGERELDVWIRPHARLDVQVLDEAERPVAGARVVLVPRFDPFAHLGAFDERWTGDATRLAALFDARTDGAGLARLAALPLAAGDSDEGAAYGIRVVASDGREALSHLVLRDPAQHHEVVRLGAARELLVTGRVTTQDERPLAGVRVRSGESVAHTDSAGRYQLALAPTLDPTIVLHADTEGYAPAEARLDRDEAEESAVRDFVLRPALAIAGRVTDTAGEPVRNAYVSASYLEETEGDTVGHGMTTDRDGTFRFAEVMEGRWRLLLSPPHGQSGWHGMQNVVVEAGDEDVELELVRTEPGAARIRVRVLEAATGRPLDPEDVHVTNRSPFSPERDQFVTDVRRVAGGAVVDHVRPGAWRVWVRAGEHVPGHADVEVQGDEEHEVTIELGDAGSLSGTVRGLETAVGAGWVHVELPQSGNSPSYGEWSSEVEHRGGVELGPDGAFRFPALKAGRYRVRAEAYPFVASGEVEVRPGTEAHVELAAIPGGWLNLSGPEPEGKGWIEVQVTGEGGWTSPVHYARREEGRFLTGMRVPPGAYAWEVRFRDESSPSATPPRIARGEAVVTAEGSADVWVVLP